MHNIQPIMVQNGYKHLIIKNSTFGKQNILDLAGNVWEWTLENSNISSQPCVIRGGSYESSASSELSVNSRSNNTSTQSYWSIGFRITIF